MNKKIARILSLVVALSFALLATAHGAGLGTCRYVCRNSTTGQITFRSTTTSESACCSGEGLSCPTGTSFDGPLSWNGQLIRAC